MTETSPTQEKAGDKAKSGATGDKPARGGGTGLAWLALLLGLGAAVSSGYLWYLLTQQEGLIGADVAGRTETVEQKQARFAEAQQNLAATDQELESRQAILEQSIATLSQELGKQRRDWTLEEAAQLLIVANSRVVLARDIPTAIRALAEADQRLDQLSDPALFEIRKKIAADIVALQLVERPDIAGMVLRLDNLAHGVDKLPLTTRPHFVKPPVDQTTEQALPAWRRFLADVWADVKTLVKLREIESDRPPLLPREQSYFLRENLRLMLHGARLAMLGGESAAFSSSTATAIEWLNEYFDTETEPVRSTLGELERMRQVNLTPELPDISGSLQALRNYQKGAGGK